MDTTSFRQPCTLVLTVTGLVLYSVAAGCSTNGETPAELVVQADDDESGIQDVETDDKNGCHTDLVERLQGDLDSGIVTYLYDDEWSGPEFCQTDKACPLELEGRFIER